MQDNLRCFYGRGKNARSAVSNMRLAVSRIEFQHDYRISEKYMRVPGLK